MSMSSNFLILPVVRSGKYPQYIKDLAIAAGVSEKAIADRDGIKIEDTTQLNAVCRDTIEMVTNIMEDHEDSSQSIIFSEFTDDGYIVKMPVRKLLRLVDKFLSTPPTAIKSETNNSKTEVHYVHGKPDDMDDE